VLRRALAKALYAIGADVMKERCVMGSLRPCLNQLRVPAEQVLERGNVAGDNRLDS
jgi:hypothetical protein